MQEIDAADVLERYSRTLADSVHVVSDVDILPYPKPVIHAVLVEGLERFKDAASQNVLSAAFLSLANFQIMTDDEKRATEALTSIVAPMTATSADLKALALETAALVQSHAAVVERSRAELEVLRSELSAILAQT